MKQAVHFGAGNIGRGFIGALFSESGYHVTFVDIAAHIIDQLNTERSYQVKLATEEQQSMKIEHVSGLNNLSQEKEVIDAIKEATYVTTAIGPTILPRIAPLIAQGIAERVAVSDEKLYVIACENQIAATDRLKESILEHLDDEIRQKLKGRIFFFNSAVDRIVPIQDQSSLDVLVEPYFEWVVEANEHIPNVEGMTIVDDLAPFIERKLFTVNTGHAVTAYLGYIEGKKTIDQALNDESVVQQVRETLKETGAYLVKEYGLDEEEHLTYIHKNIERFKNRYLNDGVTRVGRAPIRKLGPQDRLIRPLIQAYKAGLPYTNLAKAIAAALMFDAHEDEEALEIQAMINEHGPSYVLKVVSKLDENSDVVRDIVRHYDKLKAEM
ncbi:mannitol-1-phosphate 5-dehydrogenase [Halalkalibacter sp. APA_J-10(15)]|uniref:mannitol-1-phosphate 5-dehydrogenase n=1 Tax=Halalkalibacter sp. APA_J-10(15) TaxID=2933805 RepID=UPI001FF3C1FB|nr:mannitol-1-phosphate 5-dehydrogenase [Halalkalibacter sp. APA_J-10(15)]MCK0470526.1 mannitol-1-phosphate 5-dehydrogenase [Halalkalibacter sp. APA_J-10(15)]